MLQFTKEADYGLQLVLALTKMSPGQLLSLKKFSQDSNISFLFLQRIAKKLREAGIIRANKGARGGYGLSPDWPEFSLRQVMESVEGSCAIMDCLRPGCACKRCHKETCVARKIFGEINQRWLALLSQMKLKELI